MLLLIIYGVVAIGVSFLCSILEASLLSLPRSKVEAMANRGSRTGHRLKAMKENIDRPLAAILTLNTVAHTVGAAGVGAQAAVVFGDMAVGIASAVMTLAVLVFSEIIPKTLGAMHATSLAGATATTTQFMIWLCLPLILALEQINRLVGTHRPKESLSRAEVLATIQLGRRAGSIGEKELRIVTNVLSISGVKLKEVLTPRTVVFALPDNLTVGQTGAEHGPLRFARIPLYKESLEDTVGYVPRFEIQKARAEGRLELTLADLARPLPAFPEHASVSAALEQMLRMNQQIAMVVDEYGGLEGIVTLEDLMEKLLGREIVDETDQEVDLQELARRRARRLL